MNIFTKLLGVTLGLGAAGLFVIKKPDGSTWISTEEITSILQQLKDRTPILTGDLTSPSQTPNKTPIKHDQQASTIYRWKDKQGNWQFSDKAPNAQHAETIHISGNLNKDLANTSSTQDVAKMPNNDPEVTTITETTTSPLSDLSPEKIQQLLQDAKNIQNIMDDRKSHLDKQVN